MKEMFYDRITQSRFDQIESRGTVLGQWLLVPDSPIGNFLNSIPVTRGDFLVPNDSGEWSLLCSDGDRFSGAIVRAQIPDGIESESIRTISRHLVELISENQSWLEWVEVVPLIPSMSDEIKPQPLEELIKKKFGFVKAACVKPRANLQVEIERISVSKARRVSTKASAYLAAHTEDWDRPQVRGVLPKRILAEVRDDQIDIYENRVVARLIDLLLNYLSKRIQTIRKLLKVFDDKENYSGKAGGTYLRRKRISTLWGNSIDANEGRKSAEYSLRELERIKYKLMGLMDTELYQGVPRRAFVATTLRLTNIFTNDQNYKHVAQLWREAHKTGFLITKNSKEAYLEAQELCSGLDNFSFLLVVKALNQLGYEPETICIDTQIKPGCRISLVGHGTSFELEWIEDGSICLKLPDLCLRLITLTSDLVAGSSDTNAMALIERIQSSVDPMNGATIFLYAASEVEDRQVSPVLLSRLHSVGNNPRTGLHKQLGFMPVSPWDIGSVERVARILRWAIDSERYLGYPIEIPISQYADVDLQVGLDDHWLEKDQDILRLIRPPTAYEWQQLGIERQLAATKKLLKEAERNHESISDALKIAVRDGKTGTLNQQKKASHQLQIQYKKKVDALEHLTSELSVAKDKMMTLLECPACRTSIDPLNNFEARSGGSFKCSCFDCKAIWGTRLCLNGHKFSVMLPREWVEEELLSPGWEDRIYGSDLLAVPSRNENGEWGFVCPQCGAVTT